MIRTIQPADIDAIVSIYNYYVLNTVVSFEQDMVDVLAMKERIAEVQAANLPWLVAEQAGKVIGYAYASKWKGRCAYRYSVETTVYLDHNAVGQGVGSKLYIALLDQLRALKYHIAIGGVALPNDASVKLHEKLGFKKVAHFQEVGFKLNRWIDVAYWQVIL